MPLSAAQLTLHWSAAPKMGWARVCSANSWFMVGGRMSADACKSAHGGWHQRVWAFAEELAAKEGRAVGKDDLRKGTYILALGSPKSLKVFTNGDLDRVLCAFAVLIEPDNLRFVRDFLAYEEFDAAKKRIAECKHQGIPVDMVLPDDPGEIRRQMFFLKQTPEAVRIQIARDRFGGQSPEDMNLNELRQFTMILKNRRTYEDRPAVRQPYSGRHVAASDDDPY